MKEKPLKLHWRGQFNYRHEVHILYSWATTERGAWRNFCYTLAKIHDIEVWFVMSLFEGEYDNFSIERVKEATDENETKIIRGKI